MARRDIEAGSAFVRLFVKNGELRRGLAAAKQSLESFAATAGAIGAGMVAAGAGLAAPLGVATKTFADFQDKMAAVGAVTGSSQAELAALTEQAKTLGRTTSYTASEIASLQTELGRAGFKPQEILDATTAIQQLGRATNTDLAKAAEIAGAALRQFSLPATEAARVADVLAATANNSAQTVLDIGEAFAYVGPVATDAGMSIEDTAAALGVLANLGLKGSMGGTGLRRAVLAFADPKVQKGLKGLGVDALDAQGNLRPLADVMIDLGKATESMPNAQRLAMFQDFFDLRGMTAGMKLSGSQEELEAMTEAIANSGGTAARTATQMDDTLGGAMRRITSAFEGVQIAIGKAMDDAFRPLEGVMTSALGGLTAFVEKHEGMIPAIAGIAAGLVAAGSAFLGLALVAKGAALVLGVVSGTIATLGFLLTYGLPIVGIGLAIAVAAQNMEGFGDYLSTTFGPLWEQLGAIITGTWEGIKAALIAGDWQAAVDIAMAGIEAAMAAGMVPLRTLWEDFKYAISESLAGGVIAALDAIEAITNSKLGFMIAPQFATKAARAGMQAVRNDIDSSLRERDKERQAAIQGARDNATAAQQRVGDLSSKAAAMPPAKPKTEAFVEDFVEPFEEELSVGERLAQGQSLKDIASGKDMQAGLAMWGDWLSTANDVAKGVAKSKIPVLGSFVGDALGAAGVPGGMLDSWLGEGWNTRWSAPEDKPIGEGAMGTFSATAAMAMGAGFAGSPAERTAKGIEKLYPEVQHMVDVNERMAKLLEEFGIFA